jgi:type IV secretion system protein VirD4
MNHHSHIIVDIKGALYEQLHTKLEKNGYHIHIFDFISFNHEHYDPIAFVHSQEDALVLASALIPKLESVENADFWSAISINVLTALIGYARLGEIRKYGNRKSLSLPETLKLVPLLATQDSEYCNALIGKIARNHPQREKWWTCQRLAGLAGKSPKTEESIVLTIQALTNAFSGDSVEKMLAYNDFDPLACGKEKTAIFIQLKDYDTSLHQLAALMIMQSLNALIKCAGNGHLDVPVQIWMDDCGSYTIPHLTNYLACCRSRGIGFTLLCQSEHQLRVLYGDMNGETITQCCRNYIYMGGEDVTSAKRIALRGSVLAKKEEKMFIIEQGQKLKMALKLDEESKIEIEKDCQLSKQALEEELSRLSKYSKERSFIPDEPSLLACEAALAKRKQLNPGIYRHVLSNKKPCPNDKKTDSRNTFS